MKAIYLGRRDYHSVLALQKRVFDAKVLQAKVRRGVAIADPPSAAATGSASKTPNVIMAVEHSPNVITMGKRDTSGGLLSEETTSASGSGSDKVEVVKTSRGGGLTWHGHGQVTVYPILDVQTLWKNSLDPSKGKSPLTWYSSVLEECMIRTAADYGVKGERGAVGVWVRQTAAGQGSAKSKVSRTNGDSSTENKKDSSETSSVLKDVGEASRYADATTSSVDTMKLGAVGLAVSNWVSMHGIGFNVSNDLSQFDQLVMCELPGKKATNLHREIALESKRRKRSSDTDDGDHRPAPTADSESSSPPLCPELPEVAKKLVTHLHAALQQPPQPSPSFEPLEWCSEELFGKSVLSTTKPVPDTPPHQ